MANISIEEMKQRILKPRRNALNAKATSSSSTPHASEAAMDGSRRETHRSMESGSMANQASPSFGFGHDGALPQAQGFYRGTTPLRIPKPSELFGIHTGMLRNPTAPAHSALQSVPQTSGVSALPQLPPPGVLSAPSATRQKEHDRRIRTLSTKLQRANLKRRLQAATENASWGSHAAPPPPGVDSMLFASDNDFQPGGFTGLLGGLRRWMTGQLLSADASPTNPLHPDATRAGTEQDVGVHLEFDTDVVDALVYTVGRWMGLDTDQLRDSPGLRTLVSRNIQWFRNSPDWMKLLGLVMAKKLNHTLECPRRSASDTQRMLLDRMLMQANASVMGQESGGQNIPPAVMAIDAEVETGSGEDPKTDIIAKVTTTKKRSPSLPTGKRSRSVTSSLSMVPAKAVKRTKTTEKAQRQTKGTPPSKSSKPKTPTVQPPKRSPSVSPKTQKTLPIKPTKKTQKTPASVVSPPPRPTAKTNTTVKPNRKRPRSCNPLPSTPILTPCCAPGSLPPVSLDMDATESLDPLFCPPSLSDPTLCGTASFCDASDARIVEEDTLCAVP